VTAAAVASSAREARRVVRVGGERVQLSAKEFDLLVALAEDPERVFCKEDSCATSGASASSAGRAEEEDVQALAELVPARG
jgi:DNA-binding response OmpR family regulator